MLSIINFAISIVMKDMHRGVSFSCSRNSGAEVNEKNQRAFNTALNKYKAGQLKNDVKMRAKKSAYKVVNGWLLQYFELRGHLYICDKWGLRWALLKKKSLSFAKQLRHGDEFKASNGWIQSSLKPLKIMFLYMGKVWKGVRPIR